MKTILLTGGAGFIGSNTAQALLARGDRVVCVDNFTPNYDPSFKESNIKDFSSHPNFVLYKTDIINLGALKEIFEKEKPSVVVHLAAKADTRLSIHEPQAYIDTNLTGTLNLLECSKEGVEKFIFASSSSVYGNKAHAPFIETDTTDFALAPYGATKKAGEILCYTYNQNFKLPVVCLRIFNAYGERNRPDLVLYKWIEKLSHGEPIEISGDGSRTRDFTYIGDLVDALLRSIDTPLQFEIINIGNADPVALNALLEMVESAMGKKAEVISRPSNKGSVELTHANVSHAKEVLGWEPKTPTKEGVKKMVEWFMRERA